MGGRGLEARGQHSKRWGFTVRLKPIFGGRQGYLILCSHSPIISSSLTRQSRCVLWFTQIDLCIQRMVLPRHDLSAVTSVTWHVARGNEASVSVLLFPALF